MRNAALRVLVSAGVLALVELQPLVASAISGVTVTPAFFNPSIAQKQTVSLKVSEAGQVVMSVLDRDRYLIRKLEPLKVSPGTVSLTWDGKDQSGEIVADEAYNLVLEFSNDKGSEKYDPSASFHSQRAETKINFYSREDGVLSYTLLGPSRVHAEAGQSRTDPKTKKRTDIILKTLVDSAPRVGGSVIEKWNGMDAGGTISVPALPDFVVAVLAMPLPESSMITIGNRAQSFPQYALKHRPSNVTRPRDLRASVAKHHSGLTALEDRTPPLDLKPTATWDATRRAWVASPELQVGVTVAGDGAAYFLAQPTDLTVMVDGVVAFHADQPEGRVQVTIPPDRLKPGRHLVAFNWASRLGPVASNAMEVEVEPAGRVAAVGKGLP